MLIDLKSALAYLCIVQLIAAVVYLVLSAGMDTPFKNAVMQYPQLVAIKTGSATKRRNLYLLGLVGGVVTVVIWNPFVE
jgi:nicotinamide riboside transporter PnuC